MIRTEEAKVARGARKTQLKCNAKWGNPAIQFLLHNLNYSRPPNLAFAFNFLFR